MFDFFEFFAGGGMARLGLGERWNSTFANDISSKKAASYLRNFPESRSRFRVGDVADLAIRDLPGHPDLVWASFPCQDLSLAGNGAGLAGKRSGAFWPFWSAVCGLKREGRGPTAVVVENVPGILTSHGGTDFQSLVRVISDAGFLVGALTMDAIHFLPQSRPRVFLVAVSQDSRLPQGLHMPIAAGMAHSSIWRSEALRAACHAFPAEQRQKWIWWRVPEPAQRRTELEDLLEPDRAVPWSSAAATSKLLAMMSPLNRDKVRDAQGINARITGCVYKRTRDGQQRAEVRFDGVSGCIRTPGGGSSRQTILQVHGGMVRSRLLSAREAARLMGLPDAYTLPENYNDAYHLAGDGLAVPVVSWLERHLLAPLMQEQLSPLKPSVFLPQHLVPYGSVLRD